MIPLYWIFARRDGRVIIAPRKSRPQRVIDGPFETEAEAKAHQARVEAGNAIASRPLIAPRGEMRPWGPEDGVEAGKCSCSVVCPRCSGKGGKKVPGALYPWRWVPCPVCSPAAAGALGGAA